MRQCLRNAVAVSAAALASLAIAAPARAGITPVTDCLVPTGGGSFLAYFGYVNDGVSTSIPFGDDNQVVPGIGFQGQPTVLSSGSYPRVFRAVFNSNAFQGISWILNGGNALASLATPLCAAGATGPASDLAPGGATIHGLIDSQDVATHYYFDYGPTIAYGSSTAEKVVTAPTGQLVQETLSGLTPGTTYHYRLAASGALTTVGDDHTFTTPATPIVPTDLTLAEALAPASVHPGDLVTATLTASNAGPAGATGVQIVDALPAGVEYDATASSATCSAAASTVTCGVGSLDAGASATANVAFKPTTAGTASNVAIVAGDQPDPAPLNNKAGAEATVTALAGSRPASLPDLADLGVKRSGAKTAHKGKRAALVLTVADRGPLAATGTTLVERLPSGVKLVSAGWSGGKCSGHATLTCKLGTIAVGRSVKVTVRVLARKAGRLNDVASVAGSVPDTSAVDNLAIGTLRVR